MPHTEPYQSFSPALERQIFHKEREPRALNSIKQLFDSRLLSNNLDGNSLNLTGAKPRINYTATHMETCSICLLLMAEPGRQRGHRLGRGFAMSPLSLRHAFALAFPPTLAPEVSHPSAQVNSQMGEMRHVPLYPMSAGIEAGRNKSCLLPDFQNSFLFQLGFSSGHTTALPTSISLPCCREAHMGARRESQKEIK